jgi:hypothetical protein
MTSPITARAIRSRAWSKAAIDVVNIPSSSGPPAIRIATRTSWSYGSTRLTAPPRAITAIDRSRRRESALPTSCSVRSGSLLMSRTTVV